MNRADSSRTRAELDEQLAEVLAGLLVAALRAEWAEAETAATPALEATEDRLEDRPRARGTRAGKAAA